jgi:hypothetical protein
MTLLWVWVIFNIFIGIYEIYSFQNRYLLDLDNIPKWNNSILATWNEYCRVDPRYIMKHYVWIFELLNAFYAFLLFFILFFHYNKEWIKYILFLEIISCSLYFLTLIYEYYTDPKIRENILENSTITNRIIYYGISCIWIIIPIYLYKKI